MISKYSDRIGLKETFKKQIINEIRSLFVSQQKAK